MFENTFADRAYIITCWNIMQGELLCGKVVVGCCQAGHVTGKKAPESNTFHGGSYYCHGASGNEVSIAQSFTAPYTRAT